MKMTGEAARATRSAPPIPARFTSKPRWQRLMIAFAGPAINIVLAVALLTGLFMVHYRKGAEPAFSGDRISWRRTARRPRPACK